jgi:BirA family transcriptional regulator, biotin operon repressor / biotin---[acetyl-CoA-carboxylase] ligase
MMDPLDELDPDADHWPPRFPPLLSGREVKRRRPLDAAVAAAAEGCDAGLVAYAVDRARLRMAIVLAPEVPLARAVQVGHVMMVAAGDSIGALAPPEVGISYRWPGLLLVNGGVSGWVQLAAAGRDLDAIPDWLVLSLELRLRADGRAEPGQTPGETALYEEGTGAIPPARLIESASRHFLTWLHRWDTDGFKPVHDAWMARAEPDMTVDGARFLGLDEDGRALLKGDGPAVAHSFAEALVEPHP